MKLILLAAAVIFLVGADPPAYARPALPEVASRCLLRGYDAGGALTNCTLAIAAGGMSAELAALVYDARGGANCERSEFDLGIADLDEAIRLVPDFPQAYRDRALCRMGDGEAVAALADYGKAIALAPRTPGFLRERARLYNWTGKHDQALADYDAAIALAPRFNAAMDERAKTLFDLGRYDAAAAQFTTVIGLTPGDPYPVLWRHIARVRGGMPDAEEFQAGIHTLSLDGWPAPLFDLFLGRTTIEAVRIASEAAPEGECEAAIFSGEYHLMKGDQAASIQNFEEAASVCDSHENRFLTAWAELKRLVPAMRDRGPW
jgi:tetratricopeptide (TPR) repeat protein